MCRMWTSPYNRPRTATRAYSPSVWATLLLAGLLALSGCGAVSPAGTLPTPTAVPPTGTPIATPPVPAASRLQWLAEPLPVTQYPPVKVNGQWSEFPPTVGTAPSDSSTAYVCKAALGPTQTGVSIWLTRDRGASWQATGSISVDLGFSLAATDCQILVDATDAGIAVAQIGLVPTVPCAACYTRALYVTTDMGQQWAELHPGVTPRTEAPLDTVVALATYHQVSYAMFRSSVAPNDFENSGFLVSRDNLHTWTLVSGPLGPPIANFWVNPYTGNLLVTTVAPGIEQGSFFISSSGGSTWTQLPDPPFPFESYDIAVQQPFTAQPWSICGGDPTFPTFYPNTVSIDTLACTEDSGAHWVTHQLDVANSAAGANYTLVGIADDGSVLLTTPLGLERVVNGHPVLQSLGSAPNGGLIVYMAGEGNGVLWSAPQGMFSDPDPGNRIFTVRYS